MIPLRKNLLPFFTTFFLLFPLITRGATVTDFKSLVTLLLEMMNASIPVLIGAGLIGFLFGVVKYITAGEDEEKMGQGRTLMIYGVVALFAMITVWGLVGILTATFFGGTGAIPQLH